MAPKTKELNERDTKLVQWLNEAHVKETELEDGLAGHVGLTQKASYKKRLQQHLKETREHKRAVARRIKALGGTPIAGPAIPAAPQAVGSAAGKAIGRGQEPGRGGASAAHRTGRHPRPERAGGAARGARGDRAVPAHRNAGDGGR